MQEHATLSKDSSLCFQGSFQGVKMAFGSNLLCHIFGEDVEDVGSVVGGGERSTM